MHVWQLEFTARSHDEIKKIQLKWIKNESGYIFISWEYIGAMKKTQTKIRNAVKLMKHQ